MKINGITTLFEMGYDDFYSPEKKIGKIRIYISYDTSTLVCHFHVKPYKMLYWKEQIENSPVECIEEMVKDSKERFIFNSAWKEQDELLEFVKTHRKQFGLVGFSLRRKKRSLNESHESAVDEIKRYRSEYAEQGNEDVKEPESKP